jgi:hypothetical protein
MAAPTPVAPRFLGVLGIAFVLGAFAAARSTSEAWHYGTESRAREIESARADNAVWETAKMQAGNKLPADVQPIADKARRGLVDLVLRRRPILEALSVTNAVLCALLAAFAMSAMRLRATGRAWLVQAAIAGAAFGIAQTAVLAVIGVERMGILLPYLRAMNTLADAPGFRVVGAIPDVIGGGLKIAFLIYLVVVMRRPAVRAMYRTQAR